MLSFQIYHQLFYIKHVNKWGNGKQALISLGFGASSYISVKQIKFQRVSDKVYFCNIAEGGTGPV